MTGFKGILAGGVALAGLAIAQPANAILSCNVLVGGTNVGVCAISTTGAMNFSSTTITGFSNITLNASGSPILPAPDLSTVTLDVSTAGGINLFPLTLQIDVFQNGLAVPAGSSLTNTFTVNNLIGVPGPSILSTFTNGGNAASGNLGTKLDSAMFPSGTTNSTVGPTLHGPLGAISADAESFNITFVAGGESANDTIEIQGVTAPEPTSLTLLGSALLGLGWLGRRRRKTL